MLVQRRFPLLLRKLDPETSISTPVPTASFIAVRIIHIPGISIHMPGILIHILPESLFTSPRNRYPHAPEYAGWHSNADSGGTPTTGRTWVGREVSGSLTYLHPLQDRDSQDARAISRARLDLLMNSGLTSLEVALLQRNPTYEPSYRRGRLLMLLEQIATSTLVALFLLAVRRQFKR